MTEAGSGNGQNFNSSRIEKAVWCRTLLWFLLKDLTNSTNLLTLLRQFTFFSDQKITHLDADLEMSKNKNKVITYFLSAACLQCI